MKKSLIFNTWKDKSNFIVSDPETVIMDQFLAPETDTKHQFLGPETVILCQFLVLAPETDIMGERNFMVQSQLVLLWLLNPVPPQAVTVAVTWHECSAWLAEQPNQKQLHFPPQQFPLADVLGSGSNYFKFLILT